MITDLKIKVDAIRDQLPHPVADPASVRFRFARLPGPVQALFSTLAGGVLINERFRNAEPAYLVGVVAHELHHAWQWRHQRARYLAGKLYRPLIERTADEVERAADRIMGLDDLLEGDQ